MKPVIVWFRNDLRLADNPALYFSARLNRPVIALFILDNLTPGLRSAGGASRWWLHHSLKSLQDGLLHYGVPLVLRSGAAEDVLHELIAETGADTVMWNRRYAHGEISADKAIKQSLRAAGIEVESFSANLLNEPHTIRTGAGGPYRVYTPYMRAVVQIPVRDCLPAPEAIKAPADPVASQSLESLKLLPVKPDWAGGMRAHWTIGEKAAQQRLQDFIDDRMPSYSGDRDRPDRDGTSSLSAHLAFGEISPVQIWHQIERIDDEERSEGNATFRRELIWREFCYHLLFHYPNIAERNYNSTFDDFSWINDDDALGAWQRGQTGYPIVDAGMRQLWQTGWMHNRVRMIVASFLTKHLMIDWRKGEQWFWDTLVDADPASNPASWQWVAGSGADAAPYFRIFNPIIQGEKFDPDGAYVRQFVPELTHLNARYIHKPWTAPPHLLSQAKIKLGDTYPNPIVDHAKARARALSAYKDLREPS